MTSRIKFYQQPRILSTRMLKYKKTFILPQAYNEWKNYIQTMDKLYQLAFLPNTWGLPLQVT